MDNNTIDDSILSEPIPFEPPTDAELARIFPDPPPPAED